MKSIVFGIVVLLALQGCSYPHRYIKTCGVYYYEFYDYYGHPINKKQCKKDKKIITNILGKGGLEAENSRNREFTNNAYTVLILIIPFAVGVSSIVNE